MNRHLVRHVSAGRDDVVMYVELWLETKQGSPSERAEATTRLRDFMNGFDKYTRPRLATVASKILATRPGNAKRIEFSGDNYRWL